jgi:Mg2+/Co2+ transporter CorB
MALIVSLVPVAATLVRGIISHREHKQNLEAVKEATVGRDEIKSAIEEVHQEVKTANANKLGEQSDLNESHRIAKIAPEDRTPAEDLHIATIPEK